MKSEEIKIAKTNHPVLSEISKRWSARAFDSSLIGQEELETLLEAASWAPSANNEQPWTYYYAHHGTAGFESLWECLMEANRPWTTKASILMVACTRKQFEKSGKNNHTAEHDLGMANALLLLQATKMNIYGHLMGGFERHKIIELLNLDEHMHPVCMIALGKLADPETLEEPYKTRELTPRNRKPLVEFAHSV
ncbi:MAG: nitroreductase family protein [Saprospiraceae bacterium]